MAAVCLLTCARTGRAEDDATLVRVFLKDGTSLVSYGEPAHVDDRVIFSMPTATTPNPPLHLVSLPDSQVDWPRTERYATAARGARYLKTQADLDYAALSERVTDTLNHITAAKDASERLKLAQDARKALAAWPAEHYSYRVGDVRQMLSLLDEAIADLRVAAGGARFDLSLSTLTEPPVVTEPLLPSPTAQEAIDGLLAAARLADTPAERTALLQSALTGLGREVAVLPPEWASATRAEVGRRLDAERSLDRRYAALVQRTMFAATARANAADIRGLEQLLALVHQRDQRLGGRRPDTVASLVAAVQAKLDAARQLRLAQDRWALRAEEFRLYVAAMKAPLAKLDVMSTPLEGIKSLAGSSAVALALVEQGAALVLDQAARVAPPMELRAAHALLVSAAQLAGNAARIRREATLAGDMGRAWDASSAAAGALMLGARARADIQSLLRPPQLR
ncbi:MAG: hypothetical protein ABUS56_06400 [Acidobacteriota bacterium]